MVRLLGIDPGTQRCGVAISDSGETMAFPREALRYDDAFVTAVTRLVEEESVALIVLGRPVSLAGTITASTRFADEMFDQLRVAVTVPVVQHDERLSTAAAQRALSAAGVRARDHRRRIDSAAAVVMLQHFLDSGHAH